MNPRLFASAGAVALVITLAPLAQAGASESETKATISQVGTYDYLVQPDFTGLAPLSEAIEGQTLGLGTFADLDGEFVMVAGVPYQVRPDGTPREVDPQVATPFAQAVDFRPDTSGPVAPGTTCADLGPVITALAGSDDGITAVRVRGTFTDLVGVAPDGTVVRVKVPSDGTLVAAVEAVVDAVVEAVVQALAHRLRASWPYAQLVCYGSMRTGLSTPTSDIDCAVLNPPPIASMQHAVYFLRSIFEQESWAVGTTALAHAALPILKLQVAPESRRPDLIFQVDVSVSSGPVHYGLIATHVFSGEIGARPPVRALTIVVKDYLASLGLNQTYTGGLCSHAIFLLARAYVVAADGGTDGRAHAADLGQMLPGFFHFYGHHFDPARVTVKWVPAKLVPRLERKPHTLPPRVTRSRGARIPRSSPLAPKEKPTRTPHASRLHVHHKCLTPLGSAGGAPTPSPSGHPSPRPRGTRRRRFPLRD